VRERMLEGGYLVAVLISVERVDGVGEVDIVRCISRDALVAFLFFLLAKPSVSQI
jgi:hypothetical protein